MIHDGRNAAGNFDGRALQSVYAAVRVAADDADRACGTSASTEGHTSPQKYLTASTLGSQSIAPTNNTSGFYRNGVVGKIVSCRLLWERR